MKKINELKIFLKDIQNEYNQISDLKIKETKIIPTSYNKITRTIYINKNMMIKHSLPILKSVLGHEIGHALLDKTEKPKLALIKLISTVLLVFAFYLSIFLFLSLYLQFTFFIIFLIIPIGMIANIHSKIIAHSIFTKHKFNYRLNKQEDYFLIEHLCDSISYHLTQDDSLIDFFNKQITKDNYYKDFSFHPSYMKRILFLRTQTPKFRSINEIIKIH